MPGVCGQSKTHNRERYGGVVVCIFYGNWLMERCGCDTYLVTDVKWENVLSILVCNPHTATQQTVWSMGKVEKSWQAKLCKARFNQHTPSTYVPAIFQKGVFGGRRYRTYRYIWTARWVMWWCSIRYDTLRYGTTAHPTWLNIFRINVGFICSHFEPAAWWCTESQRDPIGTLLPRIRKIGIADFFFKNFILSLFWTVLLGPLDGTHLYPYLLFSLIQSGLLSLQNLNVLCCTQQHVCTTPLTAFINFVRNIIPNYSVFFLCFWT